MSKLTKSLSELDAMADELLAKSQQPEEVKSEDVAEEDAEKLEKSEAPNDDKEDLKPEDVSENVPEEEVQNTEDTSEEKEESEEVSEKEEEEDVEIEKSLEPELEAEESEDSEKEQLEKSIHNTFRANEDIKKSIDASEFLSAVTEVLAKSLADVVHDMKNSSQQSVDSNDVLAKSLHASLSLNKAMSEELDLVKSQNAALKKSIENGFADIRGYIEEQFEQFSHQPATMRKSISGVSVHDRDFQKSLGKQSGVDSLSKSEVLTKLNAYMYSGNPLVQPSDIISYESGAPLRPEIAQLIQNHM